MEEIDINIIKELKKNAQTSFLRIAKKIGVSPKTVQRRHEKMRQEGIIHRSSVAIDLSKIGYQGKAYLMITNAPNQDKKLTSKALRRMQNVVILSEVIGDFDVLAIAPVRDLITFHKLVHDIKELPSVDQVEFACVADTSFPVDKDYDKLPLSQTEKK
jgi:DNA-binding Lrp family transcriptional regulator